MVFRNLLHESMCKHINILLTGKIIRLKDDDEDEEGVYEELKYAPIATVLDRLETNYIIDSRNTNRLDIKTIFRGKYKDKDIEFRISNPATADTDVDMYFTKIGRDGSVIGYTQATYTMITTDDLSKMLLDSDIVEFVDKELVYRKLKALLSYSVNSKGEVLHKTKLLEEFLNGKWYDKVKSEYDRIETDTSRMLPQTLERAVLNKSYKDIPRRGNVPVLGATIPIEEKEQCWNSDTEFQTLSNREFSTTSISVDVMDTTEDLETTYCAEILVVHPESDYEDNIENRIYSWMFSKLYRIPFIMSESNYFKMELINNNSKVIARIGYVTRDLQTLGTVIETLESNRHITLNVSYLAKVVSNYRFTGARTNYDQFVGFKNG